MPFVKKVNAGALQYVLIISVIIAIVVFAFISLLYLQQKIKIKNTFYKQSIQNVLLGFDYISKNTVSYNSSLEKQFSENALEKTTISKQYWGVYDMVTISSTIKNETFSKIGLLGRQNSTRDALYLQDNNKPLALVGDTKIVGNAYLPKQGLKRGSISGTSYNGSALIYGSQKLSNSSLPEIKNIAHINTIYRKNYMDNTASFFDLDENLHKSQSFFDPLAIHQSSGHISLKNIKLQGHIIVKSNVSIKVYPSATLDDVILISPNIEIMDGVTGSFQAFATKHIIVKDKCSLDYPSALVLVSKRNTSSKENNSITIESNTSIKGIILFSEQAKNKSTNFKPQLIISNNSTITGEVYCNQNTELSGNVYGTLYTSNFITKQFGSVYINHIYNGVINSKKLPKEYCGLQIGKSPQKVAKWLY